MTREEVKTKRLLLIALILSLLIHGLFILLFYYLAPEKKGTPSNDTQHTRQLKVIREQEEDAKDKTTPEQEQEKEEPRFAKTSAETLEQAPKEPDYIGSRDTTISGDKNPAKEQSDDVAPSMNGEDRDELNTVEQDKQDGDLEFDGLKQSAAQQPPPSPLVAPNAPVQPSVAPPPSITPKEQESDKEEQSEQSPSEEPIKTIHPLEADPEGDISIDDLSQQSAEQEEQQSEETPSPPAPELPIQQAQLPRPAAQTKPVYDPMFTPEAQPGFRTTERRSRSTGKFIIGQNAALNVEATPLGRYQELIYRRIAYYWYAMVEEKRGDIIPGSITIRLLVNHKGQLTSMELVNKRGASISQQSITFAAIRRAAIPPMPTEVQKGIVGDKLDLLFTFYFN